jgi:hypothetical protein
MPVKATGDGDAGDAQALPGYISIYLQVTDPKNATGKWDCFASYRLCVSNQGDSSKDIARDSWHRYTPHPCTRPTPVHAPPLLPNLHWVGFVGDVTTQDYLDNHFHRCEIARAS